MFPSVSSVRIVNCCQKSVYRNPHDYLDKDGQDDWYPLHQLDRAISSKDSHHLSISHIHTTNIFRAIDLLKAFLHIFFFRQELQCLAYRFPNTRRIPSSPYISLFRSSFCQILLSPPLKRTLDLCLSIATFFPSTLSKVLYFFLSQMFSSRFIVAPYYLPIAHSI